MGSKRLGLRVCQEMRSLSAQTLMGALIIDDREDTRTVFNDFETFARDSGLAFYAAKNRKQAEEIIARLKPDLCLVAGWYWLLGRETLSFAPHGFIGIHNSLLPKYRGGSPLIWPILNGEKEVGFSFFTFTNGMDDGPVWAQGRIPVEETDYISDILEKLESKTVEVLREVYLPILAGQRQPAPQDHNQATYCAQRTPNDGLVDWRQSARQVYNFIRSQSDPYPGAFTHYENSPMKLWRARLFERPYYGIPGQAARIDAGEVYVICGDHRAVILEQVEVASKRGKPGEWIKSIKTRLSGAPAGNLSP